MLPWVYAIARRVRVDSYRKRRRLDTREIKMDVLPEKPATPAPAVSDAPRFEDLMAALPQSQREVIIMLKVNGMSLEEVAAATASTVGSVKQKAHRAYERLRHVLSVPRGKE